MLIVGISNLIYSDLQNKYPDKINIVYLSKYNDKDKLEFLPSYINDLKASLKHYDITIVKYDKILIKCLDTLSIDYRPVFSVNDNIDDIKNLTVLGKDNIILEDYNELEFILNNIFHIYKGVDEPEVKEETALQETTITQDMTLEQLVKDNIEITNADTREFKMVQNKLKAGMILQAKSMLNRVLKLTTILDKLYDELLDRIDVSIGTSDTASLMYTTEYISKALSDTNQFIMSLINNEKIQNFFIVDNSKVINISDDRASIDKRQKVRKAVEIVMSNLDYFVEGDFNNIVDPNADDEKGDETSANT